MTDPMQAILDELGAIETECQQARRAHQQALALASKHEAKIAECEAATAVVVRVIRRVDPTYEIPERLLSEGSTSIPAVAKPGRKTEGTIRYVVQEFLQFHPRFTAEELQQAVRQHVADPNIGTIRAELSKAKGQGQAAKMADGTWISHIARPDMSAPAEAGQAEERVPETNGNHKVDDGEAVFDAASPFAFSE